MSPAPSATPRQRSVSPFLAGAWAAWRSVLAYVLIGTYIGIAALAHDFGFSVWWVAASTVLVWAAPAQVILVSALGVGATALETALAVALSSVRLLPMVVSLLPLIRQPTTPARSLLMPAHFTAVSMWIEAHRLLPALQRQARIPFVNGLGLSFMMAANVGIFIGYYLAASLPALLTAGLLFLTPMSFLISTVRNCRLLADWVALALGTAAGPLLAWWQVGLDLLWTGIIGGSAAYAIHRLRRALW